MGMRYFSLCMALVSAFVLTGCGGEPPASDLAAAKQALDDARDVGAEEFASQQYSVAEEAYSAAEKAVNDANSEMIKDFAASQSLISDAKSKADDAKTAAQSEKGRQRDSAENFIVAASGVMEQARGALESAPVGKGTEGDIQQLQDKLSVAEAELGEAKSSVASEDFSNAEINAKSAQQKAQTIVTGVQSATAKYEELIEKMRPWYDRI